MKREKSETSLQIMAINALAVIYPQAVCWHCPNGGKRGKVEAAIFKAMGVLAGIPDVHIARPYGRMAFVEMKKNEKEKPSDEQLKVHARLRALGHKVAVVWDLRQLDDFVRELKAEDRCNPNVLPNSGVAFMPGSLPKGSGA